MTKIIFSEAVSSAFYYAADADTSVFTTAVVDLPYSGRATGTPSLNVTPKETIEAPHPVGVQ